MGAFKDVETLVASGKTQTSAIFHQRKLHLLALFFVVCLTFSCFGLSLNNTTFSKEVKSITSFWVPNLADLGKLKYVTGDGEKEVMASVSEFSLPFKNNYVTERGAGEFVIDGLGGLVVKACLNGRVESIEYDGLTRSITLSHGKNLKTVYSNIDIVGVKVGDGVDKNTPLGISNSSKVTFKVLYKNKLLAGLSIVDGEFTFL